MYLIIPELWSDSVVWSCKNGWLHLPGLLELRYIFTSNYANFGWLLTIHHITLTTIIQTIQISNTECLSQHYPHPNITIHQPNLSMSSNHSKIIYELKAWFALTNFAVRFLSDYCCDWVAAYAFSNPDPSLLPNAKEKGAFFFSVRK